MKTLTALLLILTITACAPRPPQARSGIDKAGADVAAFMATKAVNGGEFAIVTGTSMEPELRQGDIILYRKSPYGYVREGQIIVFRAGGRLVGHRVVKWANDGWITKGDNGRYNDPDPVTVDNYVGTVFGVIWQ